METPAAAPRSKRSAKSAGDEPSRTGPLYQLFVVLGVAFILATLFTAWTPGQFAESPQPEGTGIALVSTPTQEGGPTATPRGPTIIGIVAGHWKNDAGAVCADGLSEADVNLNIASQVQKLLAERGYTVDLLQEFDARLEGYEASALVSIHADSCDFINNEATGFKVAAAMATRHPEFATRLTACLRNRYAAATNLPLHSTSVTPDMTLYHAFSEIGEGTPAAIIETGFLNLDRELLTRQSERVAQGIADGILCYIRREPITYPTQPASEGASPAQEQQPTLPPATTQPELVAPDSTSAP